MSRDGGSVAIEFAAGVALLVLPMALLVLLLPGWHTAAQAAHDAARQGARLSVLDPTADDAVVTTFVVARLDDAGVDALRVDVTRDALGVTVEVRHRVPLVRLPDGTEVGGFERVARHVEFHDPYRSRP